MLHEELVQGMGRKAIIIDLQMTVAQNKTLSVSMVLRGRYWSAPIALVQPIVE